MTNQIFGTVVFIDLEKNFLLVKIAGYEKAFPCYHSKAKEFFQGQSVDVAPANIVPLIDPITNESFRTGGFVHVKANKDTEVKLIACLAGSDFRFEDSSESVNGWKIVKGRNPENKVIIHERERGGLIRDGYPVLDWQIVKSVLTNIVDARNKERGFEVLLTNYGWMDASFDNLITEFGDDLSERAKTGWL